MKDGYAHMGVSILGGAITSFGAGFFLLFAFLAFFARIGVIICATIIFSILIAIFYLGAILHVVGPSQN